MELLKKYLLAAAAISACFVFYACSGKNQEAEPDKKEAAKEEKITLSKTSIKEIDLRIETAELKPFSGNISIPATVTANQDADALVGSLVQGRVYKVYAKAGDFVKAGQALMDIEGPEIGQIKADYLSDKANLEVAKTNYERIKALNEQKIGSQKALLEAEAEYKKASAEFTAEDRKIHSIGMTDEEVTGDGNHKGNDHIPGLLRVKAPISGIIVERNIVIGQLVDVSTNAFRILNSASVYVDGKANEKDAMLLSNKGKAVFVSTALPGEEFAGNVTFISPVIDEKTRTFTIRCDFKNRDNKLKPQMFGELLIPAAKNSKAIVIPAESIVKVDNNDCVFIAVNDTVFIKRRVRAGSIEGSNVEIREGLNAGDRVVTKGAFYIKSELLKDEFGGED